MRRVKKFKLNTKNEIILGDGTIIQTKGDKGVPGDVGEGIDESYIGGSQIPGPKGTTGLTGSSGRSGIDGIDGEDAWSIPGPPGVSMQGLPGIAIPGRDGEDGEDGLWPLGSYDPAGTGHAEATVHVANHTVLITGIHGLLFSTGKTLTLTESLTLNALPIGGLAVATGANVLGSLAVGLITQILVGGGAGTVPAFGTDIPTAVTIGSAYIYRAGGTDIPVTDGGTGKSVFVVGDIVHATGTTTLAGLADVAVGSYLASGGVGAIPAWATLNQAAVAGLTTASSPTFTGLTISNDAEIHGLTVGKGGGAVVSNTVIGEDALAKNTTATYAVAIGYAALYNQNDAGANSNIAIGAYSLFSNLAGVGNIAIGHTAIMYGIGSYNLGIGYAALGNVSGSFNSALGYTAGGSLTSGSYNYFFGYRSGIGITTGSYNVLFGGYEGAEIATLSNQVVISDGAGNRRINVDASGNTGIATTLIGAGVTYQKLNVAGSQLFVGADSTQESPMFQVVPSYVVNTHASYTSRTIFSQWAIGGAQECMRMESGAAAMLGFLGAGAVVRQTGYAVPTDLDGCIAALTALRTAGINYGLITTV